MHFVHLFEIEYDPLFDSLREKNNNNNSVNHGDLKKPYESFLYMLDLRRYYWLLCGIDLQLYLMRYTSLILTEITR